MNLIIFPLLWWGRRILNLQLLKIDSAKKASEETWNKLYTTSVITLVISIVFLVFVFLLLLLAIFEYHP